MIVRHVVVDLAGILIRDLAASCRYYQAALASLGVVPLYETDIGTVFGSSAAAEPTTRAHIAFYAAALTAGGRDNGPPGNWIEYRERYYAAYVLDPEANNIEAVHHS